jgi:hypothetical protein
MNDLRDKARMLMSNAINELEKVIKYIIQIETM